MALKLKKIATDDTKEFDLVYPDETPAGFFTVKHFDPNSPSIKLAYVQFYKRIPKQDMHKMSNPTSEADIKLDYRKDVEFFVDYILTGWRDVLDADDKPIEYNRANAIEFFEAFPTIFRTLKESAASSAYFLSVGKEDIAKN